MVIVLCCSAQVPLTLRILFGHSPVLFNLGPSHFEASLWSFSCGTHGRAVSLHTSADLPISAGGLLVPRVFLCCPLQGFPLQQTLQPRACRFTVSPVLSIAFFLRQASYSGQVSPRWLETPSQCLSEVILSWKLLDSFQPPLSSKPLDNAFR